MQTCKSQAYLIFIKKVYHSYKNNVFNFFSGHISCYILLILDAGAGSRLEHLSHTLLLPPVGRSLQWMSGGRILQS